MTCVVKISFKEPVRCVRSPMSSTMNRDEGTPVDSEVVADAVGTELTVVPGEQDQVNTPARISEVERDMAAAGKITAEDREML